MLKKQLETKIKFILEVDYSDKLKSLSSEGPHLVEDERRTAKAQEKSRSGYYKEPSDCKCDSF